jgi:hypothetical protein
VCLVIYSKRVCSHDSQNRRHRYSHDSQNRRHRYSHDSQNRRHRYSHDSQNRRHRYRLYTGVRLACRAKYVAAKDIRDTNAVYKLRTAETDACYMYI